MARTRHRRYLEEYREFLREAARMIIVIEVNEATLFVQHRPFNLGYRGCHGRLMVPA
jgi:hypothetical protein